MNKREYAKKIDSLNEEPFLKYGKEGNYTEEEHDRMVTVVTTGLQRFPEKIRETLREYELVTGSNVNACDVIHKKLYIGQDVDQYILDHEMGHLVEALFIDKDILRALKVDILKDVNDNDIITEIRHDSEGNIVPIIYVDVDDFYSSYQGRIYVGVEGLDGIFDDNRNIKVDNLWEIISETMPHYMDGEEPLNDTIAKIYELIDEVFNEKQG